VKIQNEDNIYYRNIITKETQDIKPSDNIYFLEAAFLDNLAFTKFYIEYNGNVNVIDNNKRNGILIYKLALHYSVINDNYKITELLVNNNCNMEQVDNMDQTPLLLCTQYRSYRSLKILIKHGCNINKQE
jgi:hypothetical protein